MFFFLNQKRSLKVDAAAALHLPLDDVSDFLVVKQARATMFDLTPVWAPVEPPAKRAKTAEVRLSSTGDVPMTHRVVLTKRTVTALARRMWLEETLKTHGFKVTAWKMKMSPEN